MTLGKHWICTDSPYKYYCNFPFLKKSETILSVWHNSSLGPKVSGKCLRAMPESWFNYADNSQTFETGLPLETEILMLFTLLKLSQISVYFLKPNFMLFCNLCDTYTKYIKKKSSPSFSPSISVWLL